MKKHNQLILFIFLSSVLFSSSSGILGLATKTYATTSLTDIIGGYLDGLPFYPGGGQGAGNAPAPAPAPAPASTPTPAPAPAPASTPTPAPTPTLTTVSTQPSTAATNQELPDGCKESGISAVSASGYDDNTVPQNAIDKDYNTRWAKYGKGSYIQLELSSKEIICAIDMSWHRGNVRTSDFSVSVSENGTNYVNLFSATSSGKTNLYERYLIQNSSPQAKYVRVTVNGNTENNWAAITEFRVLSKPVSTEPGPTPTPGNPPPKPTEGVVLHGGWGANPDPDTWSITNMRDKPNLFKVVDNTGRNVATDFTSRETAQGYIDYYKYLKDNPSPTPTPGNPPPKPTEGVVLHGGWGANPDPDTWSITNM
ncbi:MAG: discoidin domain-containing protein, partial [Thermoproteota archaeon]|nr:discoidin domain-containing protein [Thermoproteota archaeon]